METEEKIEIKENDVYHFRYNNYESKKRHDPYHCFDGQMVVVKNNDGGLSLLDTYWSSKHNGFKTGGGYSRRKTLEEAFSEGELKFICNLDDVEEINEHDTKYYSNEDVFDLSYQHHCYRFFVKKKGAERNAEKIINGIQDEIENEKYRIKSSERSIERLTETLKKVRSGDLNIYF